MHLRRRLFPWGLLFLLVLSGAAGSVRAQQTKIPFFQRMNTGKTGLGLTFASDFNYFFRNLEFPLINGYFSTFVVGAQFKKYIRYGMVETGLALNYKGLRGEFNFPLVSQNFVDAENTAQTGVEVNMKVAPVIFRWVYPKFGLIAGYRFRTAGFFESGRELDVNRPYLAIPVGFTVDLPTSFGTTGIGFFYKVGLTNIISDVNWDDGGRMRAFNFEIHVMFDFTDSSR